MDTQKFINQDTFIISDLHLGHKSVSSFEPMRSVAAKNDGYDDEHEYVIDKVNEVVSSDDNLLIVEDFAFKTIEYYTKRLNGKKIIILGTHDKKAPLYRSYGWEVFDGIHLQSPFDDSFIYKNNNLTLLSGLVKSIDNVNVLFSHYPVFDDNAYDRKNEKIKERVRILEEIYLRYGCELNIHGHTHSKKSSFTDSFNVSIEPMIFFPVQIGNIISSHNRRSYL